jgi:hypothetical protein
MGSMLHRRETHLGQAGGARFLFVLAIVEALNSRIHSIAVLVFLS